MLKKIAVTLAVLALVIAPATVLAGESAALKRLQEVGNEAKYQTEGADAKLANTIGVVINGFLSLLGAIFIILMVIAGYNWMIAGGDEQKVTKAKDTIRRAIIGLLIVVGSFSIWIFIKNYLI